MPVRTAEIGEGSNTWHRDDQQTESRDSAFREQSLPAQPTDLRV